jgi:nicotinate-nucleotide adenylyltransferase
LQLDLDLVVLMPFGRPPHRDVPAEPRPERRYELCLAAVEGDDRLTVSRTEIDRPGPSFTVDTLRTLREEVPDDELFFIMGADTAATLPEWREPEEVLRLAKVAVVGRARSGEDDVRSTIGDLAGAGDVRFLSMPGIGISSTMVRERVAGGKPIRYLVPEAVERYIDEHGLYREGRVS